ncbi:MAG: alpha/beta fold hydrolase [Alphaproteobacteria bacterium]
MPFVPQAFGSKKTWRRLGLTILAIGLLAGAVEVAIHHYDPTRVVYRRLKAPDPFLYERIDPALKRIDAAAMIDPETVGTPDVTRARLMRMIWGGNGTPVVEAPDDVTIGDDGVLGELPAGTAVTRLHFDLGLALTSNPYFVRAANGNGRLVVYHHGFGDPIDHVSHFLSGMLDAGFDVIALNALGHGGTLAFVDSDQDGILAHARQNRKSNIFHEMSHFDRPLRYHLRPILGALNYARGRARYASVDVVGFSMGGFFAMLMAALDSDIERSYVISGVYPNYMRRGQEIMPDGPPSYAPLLEIANHLEMFVLGASGDGRRQTQIFNRYDRCCFNGVRSQLYADIVRDAVSNTPKGGDFRILIDETHADHRISRLVTSKIIEDLGRGR